MLYVELEYPFTKRPEKLTIIPPLDEEGGIASSTIGVIAYHKAVPVIDFRCLGAASELTLDWTDPWYSKFRNIIFDIRAQWTAKGTVGHWGHIHTRQNLYDAVLAIHSVDGVWRITGMEILEETRIDPNTPVSPTA